MTIKEETTLVSAAEILRRLCLAHEIQARVNIHSVWDVAELLDALALDSNEAREKAKHSTDPYGYK